MPVAVNISRTGQKVLILSYELAVRRRTHGEPLMALNVGQIVTAGLWSPEA